MNDLEFKTQKILYNAKNTLLKYFQEYSINNPCAIFDIDDTLFFHDDKNTGNYEDGFIPNIPVIQFYKWVYNMGIPIYVITARPNNFVTINSTLKLLNKYDLRYEKVFFRPDHIDNVFTYKSDAREYLQRVLKHTNLISVGDMVWDVNSYVFIPVLLPNKENLEIPYTYNLLN